MTHVSDFNTILTSIASSASSSNPLKPIVIGHSLAGIIMMKALEISRIRDQLTGCAWLCSVPPSGNGQMTKRYIRRDFIAAMKIVWGFVLKGVCTNEQALCRELLFDNISITSTEAQRYYSSFLSHSLRECHNFISCKLLSTGIWTISRKILQLELICPN